MLPGSLTVNLVNLPVRIVLRYQSCALLLPARIVLRIVLRIAQDYPSKTMRKTSGTGKSDMFTVHIAREVF